METSKPVIPIGQVADEIGIHQKTLRIWDKLELFKCSRAKSNRRLYSLDDIELLKILRFALDMFSPIHLLMMVRQLLGEEFSAERLLALAKDSGIDVKALVEDKKGHRRAGRKKDD